MFSAAHRPRAQILGIRSTLSVMQPAAGRLRLIGSLELLLGRNAAPRVQNQRQRDNAVAHEHAEVLADRGVAEQILAGCR